ncbi:hypothetical protein ACVW0V_006332 [Bradyrhizobium elkanii]
MFCPLWQDAARGEATAAGRGLTGAGFKGLGSGCCAEARVESASAPAIAAIMIGARRGEAGIDVTGWKKEELKPDLHTPGRHLATTG